MIIDFKNVSTQGQQSSPVVSALAELCANEARYFWNKFKVTFATKPASEVPELLSDIEALLKEERDLVFKATPL